MFSQSLLFLKPQCIILFKGEGEMREPDLPGVFVSPTEHLSFIQAAADRRETDVW